MTQDMWNTEALLDVFDEMLAIQCSKGTWNANPYMHGMANGMIFMRALISDEDPAYLDAPDAWLDGDCSCQAEQTGFEDGLVLMAAATEARQPWVRRSAAFTVRALQQPQRYPDRLDEMSDDALAFEVDRLEAALENAETEQEADLILRLLEAAENEMDQRAM